MSNSLPLPLPLTPARPGPLVVVLPKPYEWRTCQPLNERSEAEAGRQGVGFIDVAELKVALLCPGVVTIAQ